MKHIIKLNKIWIMPYRTITWRDLITVANIISSNEENNGITRFANVLIRTYRGQHLKGKQILIMKQKQRKGQWCLTFYVYTMFKSIVKQQYFLNFDTMQKISDNDLDPLSIFASMKHSLP